MFRILLVDDEAQERDGIRFLIEKYKLPLTVVEAQNGQKALEYLKEHPVDILFTYGELAEQIARGAKRAGMKAEYIHFEENRRDALAEAIRAKLQPGDCVLLKGSNSMKLGEVAAKLLKD